MRTQQMRLGRWLMGLLTLLVGLILLRPISAHAATVTVNGLGETTVTVTDTTGKTLPATTAFDKWINYLATYNWSLPNGVPIANGDTAIVTLPSSLAASDDLNVDLINQDHQSVGTFVISAGALSGLITFNDLLSQDNTNRTGTLSFYVKGTTGSNNTTNTWLINKIGWIAARDGHEVPTLLTWNVAFNSGSLNLGTATINDTMGPNQTYVPGSVQVATGAYDAQGNFVADGGTLTPTVTVAGNQLTFDFSNVKTAVNMTYQVTPTVTGSSQVWTNTAVLNGSQTSAQIAWGGTGTSNGATDPTINGSSSSSSSNASVSSSSVSSSSASSSSASSSSVSSSSASNRPATDASDVTSSTSSPAVTSSVVSGDTAAVQTTSSTAGRSKAALAHRPQAATAASRATTTTQVPVKKAPTKATVAGTSDRLPQTRRSDHRTVAVRQSESHLWSTTIMTSRARHVAPVTQPKTVNHAPVYVTNRLPQTNEGRLTAYGLSLVGIGLLFGLGWYVVKHHSK